MRFAAFAIVLAGAGASAQIINPAGAATNLLKGFNFRAGYFLGTRFSNGTKNVTLSGPELGVDTNIGQIPLLGDVTLAGTVTWAGSGKSSNDQATLWRIMSLTRGQLSVDGWYPVGGFGYGTAKAQGTTTFDTHSGYITQIGIGKRFGNAVSSATGVSSAIELSYYISRDPYRGFSLDISFKF